VERPHEQHGSCGLWCQDLRIGSFGILTGTVIAMTTLKISGNQEASGGKNLRTHGWISSEDASDFRVGRAGIFKLLHHGSLRH